MCLAASFLITVQPILLYKERGREGEGEGGRGGKRGRDLILFISSF